MLGFLTGGVTLGLWKLALAGVLATLLSGLVSGLGAYQAGWRNAENSSRAAAVAAAEAHSTWLAATAVQTGALSAEDAAAELSNERLQGIINDALAKPAAAPVPVAVCVYPDFLRRLAELR